jgi:hypothetical protein
MGCSRHGKPGSRDCGLYALVTFWGTQRGARLEETLHFDEQSMDRRVFPFDVIVVADPRTDRSGLRESVFEVSKEAAEGLLASRQ